MADAHNTICDKVGKCNHDSTPKKSAVTPCVHLTLTLNTSSIIFQIKFCIVYRIFSNKLSNLWPLLLIPLLCCIMLYLLSCNDNNSKSKPLNLKSVITWLWVILYYFFYVLKDLGFDSGNFNTFGSCLKHPDRPYGPSSPLLRGHSVVFP